MKWPRCIHSLLGILPLLLSSFIFHPSKNNYPMANVETYKVTTVAGGQSASEPADGPGTKATFRDLGSMAVNAVGNIYVIDFNSLRKVGADGTVKTLSNKEVNVSGKVFYSAIHDGNVLDLVGLATGRGAIFLSTSEGAIYKLSDEKTLELYCGRSETYNTTPNGDGDLETVRFWNPLEMCMDRSGNIYLNDKFRMVRKISVNGQVTTLIGKKSDVKENGENPELKSGTGSSASLANIGGIAVDSKGNVYVSQPDIHCIVKITAAGVVSVVSGNPSDSEGSTKDGKGTAARFLLPGPIAIAGSDNIYVAQKRKIRKITPDGTVTTIAGSSADDDYTPSFDDGDGSLATFTDIGGIACDGAGNIYVTDEARVRRIVRL